MERINKISEVNSFESYEVAKRLELKTKLDYLEKKINLIAAISKLNALDTFDRTNRDDGLISAMLKHTYYKGQFEKNWKFGIGIIEAKMFEINDILENVIEIIEEVDCQKREDQTTYIRNGANYGREYVEKGLVSIFGYGIYF